MAVSLQSSLSSVMPNKRRVSAFKSLGVFNVEDLLTYYPFRITDPVPHCSLRDVKIGQKAAFAAVVKRVRSVPMNARRGYRVEVQVEDSASAGTSAGGYPGTASFIFFSHKKHYVDWLLGRFRQGAGIVASGEPGLYGNILQFTHPDVLVIGKDIDTPEEGLELLSRPQPVYHASSRISSQHIHESVVGIIKMLAQNSGAGAVPPPSGGSGPGEGGSSPGSGDIREEAGYEADTAGIPYSQLSGAVPDILPEETAASQKIMHRAQALLAIHMPQAVDEFWQGIHAMRFEEAFISQTALLQQREKMRESRSYVCSGGEEPGSRDTDGSRSEEGAPEGLAAQFIKALPFALTQGQKDVIARIRADMARSYPMSRLLQGEVGSGKTVVAIAAMLQAVQSGYQAVLVAPTQVLAQQHYQNINAMLGSAGINIPVVLLTGGMRLAERRRALSVPASGVPCITVATHAAFSSTFQAPNLALEVIDEQHRFGVGQREQLRRDSEIMPHLLVMTATPIPRSAAMTWFGNLDISWLTELPGGRKPVTSVIVQENDARTMGQMFVHARRRIDAGERVYVICPRIDSSAEGTAPETDGLFLRQSYNSNGMPDSESENGIRQLHSVEEISERLSSLPQFSGIAAATLTGRDDDGQKDAVMRSFVSGETPLLIATTVIEVGVDVPEASCIIIFDADRFGLSQLHQLRGRVGRGGTPGWAFFITRADPQSLAAERLAVIRNSSDGAEIAQADLELRGAGDVLGDAQSGGRSSFKLLRVVKDAEMISRAREAAGGLLRDDPELALPSHIQLAGAVLDFTRGVEGFITSS